MRNVTENQAVQPGAEPARRGRGRPRKPDAMSNAERQATWRARQRAELSVTVTKKIAEHDALQKECERLRGELAQAQREIAELRHRMPSEGEPAASAVLVQSLPVDKAESDDKRLAMMMNGREFFSLQRLEAHYGLPKRAVLERLIWWADRSVVQSFGEDDAAFNRYNDRRNGK